MTHRVVSLKIANAFVAELHRHHKPVVGHKFSIGAFDRTGKIVGVVIVGRPVSRHLDDGDTVEVNRLCTDGAKNACSFLYGCAARAAREIGYGSILTYILGTEPGTSLTAAGWVCDATTPGKPWGGTWKPGGPPRTNEHAMGERTRWRKYLRSREPAT